MMQRTGIEYLTHTWSPIAMRCTRVSDGCKNCWHLRMAHRHAANPKLSPEMREARAGGAPVLLEDELAAPLKLRKPAVIGVSLMGDLFHGAVPFEWVAAVFGVMATCPHHTFVVLTKRPKWAAHWFEWVSKRRITGWGYRADERDPAAVCGLVASATVVIDRSLAEGRPWPPPNVILGVSVEDQPTADERIPLLLDIPAAKRFISIEPMLDWVQLNGCRRCGGLGTITVGGYPGEDCCPDCDGGPLVPSIHDDGIHWVIAGAETGPGKRPAELGWFRSIRDQCAAAGVPFFFKKTSDGSHTLDGVVHEDIP